MDGFNIDQEYSIGFRVRNNRRTQERQQREREEEQGTLRALNIQAAPINAAGGLRGLFLALVEGENVFRRMLVDVERVMGIQGYQHSPQIRKFVGEILDDIRQSQARLAAVRFELERREGEVLTEEDKRRMATAIYVAQHWMRVRPNFNIRDFAYLLRDAFGMKPLEVKETKLEAEPLTQQQVSGEKKKSCCVCIEDFKEGFTPLKCPQCKQCFHKRCIMTWLSEHEKCPLCRHVLYSGYNIAFKRCLLRWTTGQN